MKEYLSSYQEVLDSQKANADKGLSEREVRSRLERDGKNKLP